MDISEKLLAAFQAEYVEHLEQIRTCLVRARDSGMSDAGTWLEDAFRSAHSLKGASRIAGLPVVESLAHRLEDLFSQVRSGELGLDQDALRLVETALDEIEDAASGTNKSGESVDPTETLRELDRLIEEDSRSDIPAREMTDLSRRLRSAFNDEYPQYVAGIRAWLSAVGDPAESSPACFDEAFRCVHSLKSAARIVQLRSIESIAQRLEGLLAQIDQGRLPLTPACLDRTTQAVDAIERSAAGASDESLVNDVLSALDQLLAGAVPSSTAGEIQPRHEQQATPVDERTVGVAPPLTPMQRASADTPGRKPETIRLDADNVDRLFHTASQLTVEGLHQDSVTRALVGLGRQVSEIQRQWELIRKASGTDRRAAAIGRDASSGCDSLGHQLHAFSRHLRAVQHMQRQSAWSLKSLSNQLQRDAQRVRLVTAESVFQGFRKMVRDLAHEQRKVVEFSISGLDVQADRTVLQALKDPVMHVVRNALTHGIDLPDERKRRGKPEVGQIALRMETVANRLRIVVEDDGRGLDLAEISATAVQRGFISEAELGSSSPEQLLRLLFEPGFSTSNHVSELSGRGMGLSVVSKAVTALQGKVELRQRTGGGAVVSLTAPIAASTHRLLLVTSAGHTFALPLSAIDSLHRIEPHDVSTLEGKLMVSVNEELLPLSSLACLLGTVETQEPPRAAGTPVIVLTSGNKRLAVAVDALLAEREGIIQGLGNPAAHVRAFAGGVVLEEGSVCLVINPDELAQAHRKLSKTSLRAVGAPVEIAVPVILVVDDSFTTRTLETSILEAHGYAVRVAVDGSEALDRLRSEKIDLVITDIQMPRLDGFGLLEAMKKDERIKHIPAVIVSSLDRREDQERGLKLGADAYVVKRKFDHQELLATIQQLL